MNVFLHSFLVPPYFHLWHLPVVFLAALIGEAYGTVIGSGSVLTQFVLVSLGIPLPTVIATDIAGSIGSDIGILQASPRDIWHNKKVLVLLSVPFFIGGILGTIFLIHISTTLLKYSIAAILSGLVLYLFFKRKGVVPTFQKLTLDMRRYPLISAAMVALGTYANVIGVGEGSFGKLEIMTLLGVGFSASLALNAFITLPAAIFSFGVTSAVGLTALPYVAALWIGSFISSRYVTKHIRNVPETYLRTLLILVTLIYIVYLLLG